MTLRGVTTNIIEFRRVGIAPLSALAENGRGVSLGVASTILSPCDSEHACSFHATHGVSERFFGDVWPAMPERDLHIEPFPKAVCYALIGIAAFALWSAGAFAWWIAT